MTEWTSDDGRVRLVQGDCRSFAWPSGVDAVISDPPFSATTHDGALGKAGTARLVTFDCIDAAGVAEVVAKIAPLRWCVLSLDWRHCLPLETDPPRGFRFVRFGMWVKPGSAPQFTGDRPATGWEAVAILHREGGRMKWNGGGRPAVWTMPPVHGDHPTQKPIALVTDFARLFTDADELIADPFTGSGTTAIAAIRTGRRFIGCEIDPTHYDTAVRRVKAELAQPMLFPRAEPVATQDALSAVTP